MSGDNPYSMSLNDSREYASLEDRVAEYNKSVEELRLKTGTTSERDVDPEDAGEGYGLVKGHKIPVTRSNNVSLDEPRHTAMRALIATVVATGCPCSRCERLREFVPYVGRKSLFEESAYFDKLSKFKNIRPKKSEQDDSQT